MPHKKPSVQDRVKVLNDNFSAVQTECLKMSYFNYGINRQMEANPKKYLQLLAVQL